jgi:type IX secretion system PorP/SprF family membrane protein
MKTILKHLLVVVAVGFVSSSIAQQTRQTNLYIHNNFALNPAYAGASGCAELNFSHVNQWVKITGAPTTSFFNANTNLGKHWGIGGSLLIDRLGMLQQLSASGAVSYGFTIARDHHIRLGISGGYFQMRIDPTEAIAFDNGDQIVDGGVQSSNSVNTEAGIVYQFKGLDLSFSTKQLIETRSNFDYANLEGYGLKRHFVGYAGYDIVLNKNFTLKPNLLYRGINTGQQFDFNVDVNYNDFIHFGLGWRTQVGLVGRIGVKVRKLFFLGYSYEAPMQNIASYGAGSHEVVLGLKICRKDKPIIDDILAIEPVIDTIMVHDTIIESLVVERIDTVFRDVAVDDAKLRRAMMEAEDNLEFIVDKSIIEKKSYASLEGLTNLLLVYEDVRIRLEGHTDSDGTEDYNMRLSKNRVEAMKRFLIANGVDESRIDTSHFGESKPIASNNTEAGKAQNRRVEMKILK